MDTLPLFVRILAMVLHFDADADRSGLAEAVEHEVATQGPLLKTDADGSLSAAVAVVSAWHESKFDNAAMGDHGSSRCMFQINLGTGKTREGWTGKDLEADLSKCAFVGYRALRESFKVCPSAPLAVYVSGHCESKAGRAISKHRMGVATQVWRELGQ